MLEIIERLNLAERHDAVISLDYDSRKRGRLKTLTETSEDAGLFLERGQVLMDGDYPKGNRRACGPCASGGGAADESLDDRPCPFRENLLSPGQPTHTG